MGMNNRLPGTYATDALANAFIAAMSWTVEAGWEYLGTDGHVRTWNGIGWLLGSPVGVDFVSLTTHVEGAAPVETLIGGCQLDATKLEGLTLTFGANVSWVVAGACTINVVLYDYGASPGPPGGAPTLIVTASLAVPGAGADGPQYLSQPVTVDSGGPGGGKILDEARLYRAVVTIVGGVAGDIVTVEGGGLRT